MHVLLYVHTRQSLCLLLTDFEWLFYTSFTACGCSPEPLLLDHGISTQISYLWPIDNKMAYFQLMGSFPPGYFISAITFLESTFNTWASSGMFSVNWAVSEQKAFQESKQTTLLLSKQITFLADK